MSALASFGVCFPLLWGPVAGSLFFRTVRSHWCVGCWDVAMGSSSLRENLDRLGTWLDGCGVWEGESCNPVTRSQKATIRAELPSQATSRGWH